MSGGWKRVWGGVRLLAGMAVAAVVLAVVAVVVWPALLPAVPLHAALIVALDGRVLAVLVVLVMLPSTALFVYRYRVEDTTARRTSGIDIEAIIPVFNDAHVMHRPVEALHASPYEDLRITIVLPEEDVQGIEEAHELADRYGEVRVVVNDQYAHGKGGDLNFVMEQSDAEAFALFDADQEPDPRFIPHAAANLEEYDVVRGRAVPRPEGFIESLSYYESIVFFVVPKNLLTAVTGFRFAESRNVVFRSEVVEQAGMFDEGLVSAEDLDFSHRVHAAGIPVKEVVHFPCMEEAAHTWRDWWGQRKRWMAGYLHVAHKRGRNAARGGAVQEGMHAAVTAAIVLTAVLAIAAVPKLAVLTLQHPEFAAAVLVAMYDPALLVRKLDALEEERSIHVDAAWLLVPVAVSLFGLVTLHAVLDAVAGRGMDWYRVEKQAPS